MDIDLLTAVIVKVLSDVRLIFITIAVILYLAFVTYISGFQRGKVRAKKTPKVKTPKKTPAPKADDDDDADAAI
jgi:hypothetical protein